MKKRITALLLCVVLCLGMLSTAAFADAAGPSISADGTAGDTTINVTVTGAQGKTLCALWGDEAFTQLLLLFNTNDAGKATITVEEPLAENNTYYVGFEGNPGSAEKVKVKAAPTEPVAMIGETPYTSLQAAVDAVKDNETIKVLKSGLNATVNRAIVFTVELGEGVTAPTITAGSDYDLTTTTDEDGNTKYTVTAKSEPGPGPTPSGGSSSGGTSSNLTVKSAKNGKIAVTPRNPKKGDTVTITLTPDEGYLGVPEVKDKDGNTIPVTKLGDNKYSFVMPAGKVTVSADFVELSKLFKDVNADDYFYDAVLWAVAKGITTGVTDTTFVPNGSCTRAQMVTFLWRAMGEPAPESTETPFTDLVADAYYYDAVLWGTEKGIIKGTSETTFSPEDTVTRAQTVTFLYREAGSPETTGTNPFTDVAEDAYYAGAVRWAAAEEITNGTGETTFSPNDDCTRGQIVTLLYRAR